MLPSLVYRKKVKVDGKLLHVTIEPLHFAVLENQRIVFLLFLNVVLHVDGVLKDLSCDIELSSISFHKLGLVAGYFVKEAFEVRSCYGDFSRVRHKVNQSKKMPIHLTQ